MGLFDWLFGGNLPSASPDSGSEAIRQRTVFLVYDTSQIMAQTPNVVAGLQKFCEPIYLAHNGYTPQVMEEYQKKHGVAGYQYNTAVLKALSFRHLVPVQVKQEVAKHFDDTDKQASAKRARGFLAELMATEIVESPDLREFEPIAPLEGILGPDSDVDRRLIGLAVSKCDDENAVVYLATRDGGIELELATRRKAGHCPNLFSLTSFDQLVAELGLKRDLGFQWNN